MCVGVCVCVCECGGVFVWGVCWGSLGGVGCITSIKSNALPSSQSVKY